MSTPRDGDFELVTLRSGNRAVRHLTSGEVMHPAIGPWEEAQRLYVHQLGLVERLGQEDAAGRPLRVLDVGLGAATNAVAALTAATRSSVPRKRGLEIVSQERDLAPLRLALADPEGFPFLVPWADAARALMEQGRWEGEGITWRLLLGDVRETLSEAGGDLELVFFDPFSPRANPELWTPTILSAVRERCREEGQGALLATYSAATPTRVTLLLAGYFVGAGVSTGSKQETTVAATRREALIQPLGERWLSRWERSSARGPHGAPLTGADESAVRGHPQFIGLSPQLERPGPA